MRNIKFKMINDEQFTLEVEEEETVLQMKEKLYQTMNENSKIEVKDLKFIFMGSILQDEQKLKEIKGINQTNDLITFFVMGKSKKSNVQSPPPVQTNPAPNNYVPPQTNNPFNMGGGMPNEMFTPNHLNNVIGQSIEQITRNPQMLDIYYGQMMTGMSEPEKEVFRSNLINQLKELQKNPQSMIQAMNSLNMNPEMMRYQQPYYPQPQIPCSHGFYPPNYNINQGYPPMNYAPSPYMVPNNAPPADINFEEVYKNELEQLEGIGFTNKKLNLEALKKAKGDVNLAVNFLCEWTN